jgi:hypothetical protein
MQNTTTPAATHQPWCDDPQHAMPVCMSAPFPVVEGVVGWLAGQDGRAPLVTLDTTGTTVMTPGQLDALNTAVRQLTGARA